MTSSTTGTLPPAPWLLRGTLHERPWGGRFLAQRAGQRAKEPIGEAWELSEDSVVVELDLPIKQLPKEVLGEAPLLLIKLLAPSEWLSVQVHPSDNLAKEQGLPNGKSECWFVLGCKDKSEIILNSTDLGQVLNALKQGESIEPFLKRTRVTPRDLVWVPASAIHALGPGLLVLEVQQYSDTTYRLFDWGRNRRVDHAEGVKALSESPQQGEVHKALKSRFECPYFNLEVVRGSATFEATNSWQYLFALDGQGQVNGRRLEHWQSYLLPANSTAEFQGSGSVVRVVPVV